MYWGFALLFGYLFTFFSLGFFFIWQTGFPETGWGWLTLILSSAVYLIGGLIVFVPVLIVSLVLMARDKNIRYIGLPIVVTIIYALLPVPLPGPLDEAIIFILSYWLRTVFLKGGSKKETTNGYNPEGPHEKSGRSDRPDVIDIEKIEK